MYGSGQGMMDALIPLTVLRSEYNPSFGGSSPEPVQKNLQVISGNLMSGGYDIGIATDGDADRIAILDEKGNFVDAQKTFALLLKYLIEDKKLTGGVVRGFSSSELITKICEKNSLKLYTVPIGFKYISELMVKEDILIGAEESGGIGLKIHLPERDGIFNGMLFCEMLAVKGKKLSVLISELENEFGKFYYKRLDEHLTSNEIKNELVKSAKEIENVAGMKIDKKDLLDGCKLFFHNGWVLIRASGTEPLLRIYCETQNENKTDLVLSDIINKFNINHNEQ
jgi:phosphomannomutase